MQHGKGVLFFPDASRYEGTWEENKICGEGTLIFWDGKKYRGDWDGDKFNGHFVTED